MDSRAFRICPFCQAASPVSETRCVGCQRSLDGLPLAVYGSELDGTLAQREPPPLVDLPLHEEPKVPVAASPPPPKADVATAPTSKAAGERRRPGRAAKIAIAAAIVATALAGAWLVRAQARGGPAPRGGEAAPSAPAPTARSVVPAVPTGGSTRVAMPSAPTARTAAATARPAAAVSTVHPHRRRAPSDRGERPPDLGDDSPEAEHGAARGERASDARDEDDEAAATADLRSQLDRAQQRRDAVAERVRRLRARTNIAVIKDIEDYQRAQDDLSVALDQLDRAEAEVARLHRALDGRN